MQIWSPLSFLARFICAVLGVKLLKLLVSFSLVDISDCFSDKLVSLCVFLKMWTELLCNCLRARQPALILLCFVLVFLVGGVVMFLGRVYSTLAVLELWWFSCLCLSSTGITGLFHHAWLILFLSQHFSSLGTGSQCSTVLLTMNCGCPWTRSFCFYLPSARAMSLL